MMIEQPVHRRLVGAALRRHRERLGYRLQDAADILECAHSRLSRVETGQRTLRPIELRALLDEYGVDDAEREVLLAAADPRRARGWWSRYTDVIPDETAGYCLLETIASEILTYRAHQVPDLLQTLAYARIIAQLNQGADGPDPDRFAEAQHVRRQAILAERSTPLTVIIGEAALRVMPDDPDVMREQLRWLADIPAVLPSVAIQILPLASLTSAVVSGGSVDILRFRGPDALGVVRWAATSGIGICHISPAHVADAVRAFTQLKAAALDRDASIQMLHGLAEQM